MTLPIQGRDTFYQVGFDSRKLSNHQLIIYDLHPKALRIVPEVGDKSSIKNSKEKHKEELSFIWDPNNEAAPVVVCVDESCVPENKMGALCQAFEKGDAEQFLNCLYGKEEENETIPKNDMKPITQNTKISPDTSKPSFLNSLKFFVFPLALLLIGVSYHYYYKK